MTAASPMKSVPRVAIAGTPRSDRAFPYDLPGRLMREHLVMLRALDRVALDASRGRLQEAGEFLGLFQGVFAGYCAAARESAFPLLTLATAYDPNAAVAVRMTERQFDGAVEYANAHASRFQGRPVAEWDTAALVVSAGLMRGRLAALARRVELVLLSYFGPAPRPRA